MVMDEAGVSEAMPCCTDADDTDKVNPCETAKSCHLCKTPVQVYLYTSASFSSLSSLSAHVKTPPWIGGLRTLPELTPLHLAWTGKDTVIGRVDSGGMLTAPLISLVIIPVIYPVIRKKEVAWVVADRFELMKSSNN